MSPGSGLPILPYSSGLWCGLQEANRRGWGKKESAEQKKDRLAAHEAKKAIGQERRLAKADLQGYLRYGKVLQCGDNSCSISIMTTLRSTDRAAATAAQVAKDLGIDARDIFIRLNLDFKNPNHFESTDFVMGYQAYYLAVAYRVLPDLMLQQDQKADIHFLLEDDCVLNVLEKEGVLEALVSKFKDAPLAFLGYYMVLVRAEKVDVCCPTTVRSHKFVHPLYELMSSKKPDDVDLFFMGQVPDMAFASQPIRPSIWLCRQPGHATKLPLPTGFHSWHNLPQLDEQASLGEAPLGSLQCASATSLQDEETGGYGHG